MKIFKIFQTLCKVVERMNIHIQYECIKKIKREHCYLIGEFHESGTIHEK